MHFFFEEFPYRLVLACRSALRPARAKPAFALRACLATCVALAAAAGCSDPDTLTCAWLASPDNCWSTTALMATACLPPNSESGMFSADNATCTYASGYNVDFTPALVLPLPDDPPWNFTVIDANSGQVCAHYEESGPNAKLVVNGQTVSVSASGLSETIRCPDGKSVTSSNALNLLSCPGSVGALPGHFIGYADTSVSFAVVGTMDAQSLSLFDCSKTVP